MPTTKPSIRVGIGGWTFPPWRGVFYPRDLPQKRELEHASRQVTAIEVNGTYYRTQTPVSFARWHAETPDDFMFALKASRYITNRRVLAEAGPSIERFLGSGLTELKAKLGPINWQFAPTRRYDPADLDAFLDLLPQRFAGLALRHVLEVRHASFAVPGFIEAVRSRGIGVVIADSERFPRLHDLTAPFVYARLQQAAEANPSGYDSAALQSWSARAQDWAAGRTPADLPTLLPPAKAKPRDVFIFFINGFKPKAPAAASALLARLRETQ